MIPEKEVSKMNPEKEVLKWIEENFSYNEVKIYNYPALNSGKCIIDSKDDYLIVFYDEKNELICIFFKGSEDDLYYHHI
ncbi:hypothetical protein ACJROX_13080 [Pseudalkalibacillus sp. A8]|uniref:hypothetical protein n=1 Tax=Pseudalkalibacillus sp. A8 TaxID=3382641 RepID=UPI0038B47051